MSIEEITSQKARVFRLGELPAIERGSGARTTPFVTAARGATGFLNGVTAFDPGAAIAHHVHNVAESVLILQGWATVDIDGARTDLVAGDATFVPANVPHHFENRSTAEPMKIFWTYGSLDSTRTLLASGRTGRIDAESAAINEEGIRVVTETARLIAKEGHEEDLVAAVRRAIPLFQTARGARAMRFERSLEAHREFLLIVTWESLDDHVVGFRGSESFARWRELIDKHIDAAPTVEHLSSELVGF